MKHECVDEQFTELLTAARPELSARWQDRVLAKVAAPATHRTRRWMAIAVGAAVALIGLGFVPIPMGSAKGAFSRALAMTNQAPGVHVTGRIWGPVGEWRFEQWFSQDEFSRYDLYDGEQIVWRWLYAPGERAIRPRVKETEPVRRVREMLEEGTLADPGAVWEDAPLIGPRVDMWPPNDREDVFPKPVMHRPDLGEPVRQDFWQRLEEQKATLEVRVEERQSLTLWGGRRNVADVYGHRRPGAHVEVLILGNLHGPLYAWLGPGDDVWIHMETEAQTGAIRALEQYKRVNSRWELVYCLDSIEFGAEMSEEVRNPQLPEHHVRLEDTWWRERLPRTLAAGESQDWRVALHSLEVNRKGDVFLTLSRTPKTEVTWDARTRDGRLVEPIRSISLGVRDELGNQYLPSRWDGIPRGLAATEPLSWMRGATLPTFWGRIRLTRGSPATANRVPRTITVRVTNEPAKSIPELTGVRSLDQDDFESFMERFRNTYYQTITLGTFPVSEVQPGDDLIADAILRTER